MPRDRLFLTEALGAMERISLLAEGETAESLTADTTKREALLWNFTVLGAASGQVTIKDEHPEVEWRKPVALRNRIVHGYWSAAFTLAGGGSLGIIGGAAAIAGLGPVVAGTTIAVHGTLKRTFR